VEASDYAVASGVQCVDYVKQAYSWIPWKSVGSAANWLAMEQAGDPRVQGFGLTFIPKGDLITGDSGYAGGLQIGDILIWGSDFYQDGHVAIVTAVDGTMVTVSQRNYKGPEFDAYSFDSKSDTTYASKVAGVLRG
jgi:surface antigen